MKVLDSETKFAHLGKPGTAFSQGFQRRLDIITKLVDFNDKKILDIGCGEGVWMSQFAKFTNPANVFGSDVDGESVEIAKSQNPELLTQNFVVCPAEALEFPDNFFDIVFQNEVLEHVNDDVKTISECIRVLKPGGKLIIFTPNRGWPFETHGMFFREKYYWGNIPFLPWMPKFVYKKFAPHVRNYFNWEVVKVIDSGSRMWEVGSGERTNYKEQITNQNSELQTLNSKPEARNKKPATIIYHKHVFSGFDGAVRRFGIFGKIIQKFFHFLEKTPLHFFGISHLIVVQKVEGGM